MSYFIVPLDGTGVGKDTFRPKYIPALSNDWRMIDLANACLVQAATTPAVDAQIALNADAIVATDVESPIAASVGPILETIGIPSGLAVAGITYRAMFRRFAAMAQFVHRLEAFMGRDGLLAKLQLKGNLDVQIGSLPPAVRQRWADAADDLGLDRSGISATDPIREVLRNLGLQYFASRAVRLGNL